MLLAVVLVVVAVGAEAATFYNNISRVDVNGNIIDCHSGVMVLHRRESNQKDLLLVICVCFPTKEKNKRRYIMPSVYHL